MSTITTSSSILHPSSSPGALSQFASRLEAEALCAGLQVGAAAPGELPPLAEAALAFRLGLPGGGDLSFLQSLLIRLDRDMPEWSREAVRLIRRGPVPSPAGLMAALALCARPPARTAPLLRLLRRSVISHPQRALWPEPEQVRAWLACLALLNSQDPQVWAMMALLIRMKTAFLGQGADPAVFPAFLKLAADRAADYQEFSMAILHGEALEGRRTALLKRLGIWNCLEFQVMYRRLADQVARERPLCWERLSRIRDFRGPDYLRPCLEALSRHPMPGAAAYLLRWLSFPSTSGPGPKDLEGISPETAVAAALIRPDLDLAVERALQLPGIARLLKWMRRPGRAAFGQAVQQGDQLGQLWETHGHLLLEALRCLRWVRLPWQIAYPAGLSQDERRLFREQAAAGFFRRHLRLELTRLMNNAIYAGALAPPPELEYLLTAARAGHPAAARALGICSRGQEEALSLLAELARSRDRRLAAAALEGLEVAADRHRLTVAELERRLELAGSWPDGGLEGARARCWQAAGYTLRLSIASGRARLTAYGPTGPRKSVPAAVRADPGYAQAAAARRELNQQYGSFRRRLEEAMALQRPYRGGELRVLLRNPVFADLFRRLLIEREGVTVIGGEIQSAEIAPRSEITITHPALLAGRGELESWQQRLAEGRVVQPFKQGFREIYQPGPQERQADRSLRFAGHLVLAPRCYGILKARGYSPGRGDAARDWPWLGLRARICWAEGVRHLAAHLSGELKEQPVVTGSIRFCRLARSGRRWVEIEQLPLALVDPVIFSETLRDADLLVSRAAAGELGFSSEQTVQFRAALIRQLVRQLSLWNVTVSEEGTHALVLGSQANYRVNLASGNVLLEPEGRHLDLSRLSVPEIELPYEETDSATLRVVQLVISLAKDQEISSPSFREQLGQGGAGRSDHAANQPARRPA